MTTKYQIRFFILFSLASSETIKFYENRVQNKQIFFSNAARIKINYGGDFLISYALTNTDPIEWEAARFPKPNLGLVNTKFIVTGNDKKATITINGVKEGDDEEPYIFQTDDINGQSSTKEYDFIVLKEPDRLDLESIQEYVVEGVETAISKCIARGAKPQAEIRYKLISGGNEELTRLLEQLTGTEEAMLNLNPNRNYNNAQIKCEVHHETIMGDADYETLWTRTITLDVRYPPGAPRITIDEPVCDDEFRKDKFTFSCADDGLAANPPVTLYTWTLPNGESRTAPKVHVSANMLQASERQITCSTSNEIGIGPPTTKSVDLLNQEACPANATAGILILIIFVVLFFIALGVGAFFIYKKKMLCFDDREKGNGDGPSRYTDYDIHDKHFSTYSHNNTLQHNPNDSQYDYQPEANGENSRPEPPQSKAPMEDDSDDDGPLLPSSAANQKYHQNRRTESALRHSPSRGASPAKPDDNNSYSTDYNPISERGTLQYASLNKEKLGVRQSNSPNVGPNNEIVYADLNRSSHTQQDAYV